MVFSSVIFIFCFLPICLVGYYVIHPRFRNFFLLTMSVSFYAYGEPKFVFIMLFSIFFNWLFGLSIYKFSERPKIKKAVIVIMAIFNIGLFFIFKYLNFTISNINRLFPNLFYQTNIALPIGISFFTFQAMSYVIDVYRGKGMVQKNFLNTALYITFFPQLIAGPIVRYEAIASEINSRKFSLEDFSCGIKRFIIGLAKKVIIANSVAVLADKAFDPAGIQNLSILMAWLGALGYSIQIYFDFSGYSDMAIGLGLMFGFHFNENFNYPYISKSITEFWRRWHISLGTWFRDYVYIPLGGSRVKWQKLFFNLFVVWCLTGLWHGAKWNFIFWGIFYFTLLIFEKLTGIPKKLTGIGIKLYGLFILVCIILGWILFRADSITDALLYYKAFFGLCNNQFLDETSKFLLWDYAIILIFSIVFSIPVVDTIKSKINSKRCALLWNILYQCSIVLIFIMSISFIVFSSYNPFIYFNF